MKKEKMSNFLFGTIVKIVLFLIPFVFIIIFSLFEEASDRKAEEIRGIAFQAGYVAAYNDVYGELLDQTTNEYGEWDVFMDTFSDVLYNSLPDDVADSIVDEIYTNHRYELKYEEMSFNEDFYEFYAEDYMYLVE